MATVKVIISFAKLRDDDLDTKSQVIIESLTNNPNFLSPQPSLADIASARTAYINALTANEMGGKQETLVKNQARKVLEAQLKLLGLYVEANCKNDEVIAQSSGFDIQKSRVPVGILSKPTNFKVENGPVSGSLTASCNKIDGANSYVFEYTKAPVTEESVWKPEYSSAKTHLFNGLIAGTQYGIRMAGIGTDPLLVYSDVLLRYVQ